MRSKLISALVAMGFLALAVPATACPFEDKETAATSPKVAKKDAKKSKKKVTTRKVMARKAPTKKGVAPSKNGAAKVAKN